MNKHETPLESWQIPSRPLPPPPSKLSWLLFGLINIIFLPLREWYFRMEAQARIRSLKSVGKRPIIKGPITISHPENVSFGDDVSCNPGLYANGIGGIDIGNHVHIGQNLRIITQNHNYDKPLCLPSDMDSIREPVVIGDSVWIGDNVCIVPGVTIGEGAVIAMGSIVTKDIPPLAVAGGAPARIIKMRNEYFYWKLKQEGKYLCWPYINDYSDTKI